MLATNDLIFIHMPKTGGLWVADVLRKAAGGENVPGTNRHIPIGEVPADLVESRKVFGTIRDPWSWYASLWQHLRNGVDGPPLLRALGCGSEDFPSVLRGLTDPSIWGSVPKETRGGWPWPSPRNTGLYTALVEWMYGCPIKVDVLIDTAYLYEGLSSLLGVPISRDRFPPKNTNRDRPATAVGRPEDLYGSGEHRWVEDADGQAAWVMGYDEPFGILLEPILEIHV